MSNYNNILLLVKRENEKLIAKYTNRINQLEAENELLKNNNIEANNKLVLLTNTINNTVNNTINNTVNNTINNTIDLLTKYFKSLDSDHTIVSPTNVSPTIKLAHFDIDKPSMILSEKLNNFDKSQNDNDLSLIKSENVSDDNSLFSTPLLGKNKSFSNSESLLTNSKNEDSLTILKNESKMHVLNNLSKGQTNNELDVANHKSIQRHYKPFIRTRQNLLLKKSRKYKPTESSDTDEEPPIVPIPSPVHADNTPINVLKKILIDDFSASKNNKDASYSFNNMKPYIFTLDKNNKK
jgi:hypothetical protein